MNSHVEIRSGYHPDDNVNIFRSPPMTRGSEKIGDRERKSLEGIWVARLVVALNAGKKACSILNYLRKEKKVSDFIYQSSSQIIPNSFHLCLAF